MMWRHNDDRSSYYRPCWPAWPGVVPGIPGFDVPCSSTSFTRCSQGTLTRCAGPSGANKIRSVTPGAMSVAIGPWTPGSAPLTWRSPSCVQAPTSRQWLLQRRKLCDSALITVVAHRSWREHPRAVWTSSKPSPGTAVALTPGATFCSRKSNV